MEEMQAEQQVSTPQEEIGPGRALAAAREARGVSVDDVAMRLKFAPRQIEALEADQYDQLPGIAIVRGMVRNYARLLEIDAGPLVAELEQRLRTGPITVRPTDMYVPIKEGRKEGRMFVVLSLIVLIAVGAFALDWYVRDQRVTSPVQVPSATEESIKPLDTGAQPAPASEAAVGVTQVASTAAIVPVAHVAEPVQSLSTTALDVEASEPGETSASTAESETAAAPVVFAAATAAGKALQMRFKAEAWVEVKDANERLLIARLAPAGSQIAVDGVPPLSIVVGNADAVEMLYQGEPVDIKASRSGVARLTLE